MWVMMTCQLLLRLMNQYSDRKTSLPLGELLLLVSCEAPPNESCSRGGLFWIKIYRLKTLLNSSHFPFWFCRFYYWKFLLLNTIILKLQSPQERQEVTWCSMWTWWEHVIKPTRSANTSTTARTSELRLFCWRTVGMLLSDARFALDPVFVNHGHEFG